MTAALKLRVRLAGRIQSLVWNELPADCSPPRAAVQHGARVAWLAVQGFRSDACALRSCALAYASLMAFVPVLAVSFAFLRGFGWSGQRLEPMLLERFAMLSPEAVATIISYIDNTSIAGLGVIGGLFVVGSALSVMRQVEDSLDLIWGNPRPRGLVRRSADSLVLLVAAPLLLALAASVTAALRTAVYLAWLHDLGGVGPVLSALTRLVPYGVVCGLFTFLYAFLPNAEVRLRSALAGGIAAGIAWQVAQNAYVAFQFGMRNYNAIYGTLAQLPVLMLWMTTSWFIVLAGAELSAVVQNFATLRREQRATKPGTAARERLALALVCELAEAAHARRAAPTLDQLSHLLDAPLREVTEVVVRLSAAGLVHMGGDEQAYCFLSLAPSSVALERVVAVARDEGQGARSGGVEAPTAGSLRDLLGALESSRRRALGAASLADLVDPRAGRRERVGPSQRIEQVGPSQRIEQVDPSRRIEQVDPSQRIERVDPSDDRIDRGERVVDEEADPVLRN
ncbi:MAG: YihY/virulence factor BrkB family protein [Deltaproteobacteria bacterium]|nr:YihY/virulence factor BrkB family protein [Deltaproteobacteria bacterium]